MKKINLKKGYFSNKVWKNLCQHLEADPECYSFVLTISEKSDDCYESDVDIPYTIANNEGKD